jgi:hypothetical protein
MMCCHAIQFQSPVKTCLIYILGFILSLAFLHPVYGQTVDSTDVVRTIDLTGKHPRSAMLSAVSASREDVIVVLIRGGDQDLVDKTKGQLKALVYNGYERIGLVISDKMQFELAPAVYIFSDGTIYAKIYNAKTESLLGWKIYNLVRDAYQDNILPKMRSSEQKEK